jgi:major membrane immunogen (membrane-anchored lipoprotein)
MRRTIAAAAAVIATALLLGACGENDPAVSEGDRGHTFAVVTSVTASQS